MTIDSAITQGVKGLFATGLVTLLVACGGSGGGSSSGSTSSGSTDVVARGVITQLGSIHVNGVKYELPSSGNYSSDDDNPSGDDVAANLVYQVGQMVNVRGRRNDDGVTGTATEVEYEAEVEGAAQGGQILGITILQTPNTNNIAPGSPDPLSDATRYEVSGVWLDDTTIEATFIKLDDDPGAGGDGIDEIKGFVDSVDPGSNSFVVRGITFNGYTGAPLIAPNDYVEVHFDNCSGNPLSCNLTGDGVQLEDDFFDQAEGYEVEIEGAVDMIPTDCPPAADFKVDGVCVDSGTADWMDGLIDFGSLAQGSRVEAEGHMINATPVDYMRADEVKGRGNRVRIESIAGGVSVVNCEFTLIAGKIDVEVHDCTNAFEGEASNGDPLSIDNLSGEEIEVRGIRTGPTSMMALRIKEDGLSSGDRHEVRAEVDLGGVNISIDPSTLTVMGLVSRADACTELELGDMVISGDAVCDTTLEGIDDFLMQVDDDTNATNGPRDVMEIGFRLSSGSGTAGSPYLAEEWEIEEEDD